jgi:hypothetical protein
MTIRLLFEEESGSSTGRRHPHNGYYAGDFSGRTPATPAPASAAGVLERRAPDHVLTELRPVTLVVR